MVAHAAKPVTRFAPVLWAMQARQRNTWRRVLSARKAGAVGMAWQHRTEAEPCSQRVVSTKGYPPGVLCKRRESLYFAGGLPGHHHPPEGEDPA